MSEKELQAAVIKLATLYGWRHYHTYNSRKSVEGFPDLVLVRPPRLLFVELKSETGIVSKAQELWIQVLSQVPGVEACVWRPSDWRRDVINQALTSFRKS